MILTDDHRLTMRGGRSAVGARHARVCVVEDTDPSPVDRISWWKVVRAPSRPFGQKTNLLSQSSGIRNRDVRVAEIVVRELEKAKPDKWGCVKARELWSPEEERQVRPGHFWMLKFDKVPGTTAA